MAFVVIVAVAVAIPVWATDTPAYCASCKATERAGASWERSSHAAVSCVECHVPPGAVNAVKWRTREWLNIWADYLDVQQVPCEGQCPTNENCLQCHTLEDIPSEFDDVRMPHESHVDLRNLTCSDCHKAAAHPKPSQSGSSVSMAVCSMCHEETSSPTECDFCHLTPPPADVHTQDYLETHGEQAQAGLASCLRCHHSKTDFCDACHANPPPDHFSGTWRYAHGDSAKADPQGCSGCHSKDEFCDQCHRVQHPDDWARSHGSTASESAGSCLVCHPRGMCDACHEQQGAKVAP